MSKNERNVVAEQGVGTIFYAVPTGNRLKRSVCPFGQAIKIKATKVARVNAEFERLDDGSTMKFRLHSFHLNNVFDECNGGFTLYRSQEELDNAYKIMAAGLAIRNWDAIPDSMKLKVAETLGIQGLEVCDKSNLA